MNRLIDRTSAASFILFALILSLMWFVFPSPGKADDTANDLVSIGQPGAAATKFRMWTSKEEGQVFHPGDRIILFLNADRQAYVTLLAISSDGNIAVVLPNRLMPDNLIEPKKLYALFGDDSPVRLTAGESLGGASLAIYLSSTPFTLEPLKIPKDKGWLTIQRDARKEIQILKEKLETLANGEEFNRATVSLPSEKSGGLEVRLTEVPQHGVKRALPGGIESSAPETLTGTAGLKPLRKGKLKD